MALSARKALPPLPNQSVVRLGQGIDESSGFRQASSLLNRHRIGICDPIGDVLGHSAVEEVDVLTHQGDTAAQILKLQGFDGDPIQTDTPAISLIQPQQQLHHRALAGPRRPDNAEGRSRLHGQIEALQQC